MLKSIEQAAENFCIHQIGSQCSMEDGATKKRTLIASIDINTQEDTKYRVYLASDEAFLQRVCKLFLEEDTSDEETMQDMLLETVNLIVGSAKVIAKEENTHPYTIQTPSFEKVGHFDLAYDEAKTIKLDNDELTIAIKELDA